MAIIETLEAALKPWSDYYGNHKMLQAGVEYLHIGALLVGGGFAIASDRSALRAMRGDQEQKKIVLREFSTIHKPVIIALSIMVLSGLTMLSTDIGTFLTSPVFWTKMTLVVLLLSNGYLVTRTEEQLNADPSPGNRAWPRFKHCAVASMILWLSTALAGVILLNS